MDIFHDKFFSEVATSRHAALLVLLFQCMSCELYEGCD